MRPRMGSPYDEFASHFKYCLGGFIEEINKTLEQSRQRDDTSYANRCSVYEALDRKYPSLLLQEPPGESSPRVPAPCSSTSTRRAAKLRAGVVPRRKAPQCYCSEQAETGGPYLGSRYSSPVSQNRREFANTEMLMKTPERVYIAKSPCNKFSSPSLRHFNGRSCLSTPPRVTSPGVTTLMASGPTLRRYTRSGERSKVTISIPEISLSPMSSPDEVEGSTRRTKRCPIPAPPIELPSSCESHNLTCGSSTSLSLPFVTQAVIMAEKHGLIVSIIQPEGQPPQLKMLYLLSDQWELVPLTTGAKEASIASKSADAVVTSPVETSARNSKSQRPCQKDTEQEWTEGRGYLPRAKTRQGPVIHRILMSQVVLLCPYGVIGPNTSLNVGCVVCGSAARRLLISHSCSAFVEGMSRPYRVFLINSPNHVNVGGCGIDPECAETLKAGRLVVLEFASRVDWVIFVLVSAHFREQQVNCAVALSYGRVLWMLAAHLWHRRKLYEPTRVSTSGRVMESPPMAAMIASHTPLTLSPVRPRTELPPRHFTVDDSVWRCRGAFAAPTRFVVPPAEPLTKYSGSDESTSIPSPRGRRFGLYRLDKRCDEPDRSPIRQHT
ncbi:hypothetical protein DPX39_100145100 [Trypanosoma brucei equiperdum]|uniref:Uncharacterized protein n=1 Tax=Trypanosoma brucei equiperdum TaxID=630700 RepID=A0A3L6L0M4_9TRYP|nr:hypothetical protein DPX39_100145100 [Trypanosoma brucei equiperdum]